MQFGKSAFFVALGLVILWVVSSGKTQYIAAAWKALLQKDSDTQVVGTHTHFPHNSSDFPQIPNIPQVPGTNTPVPGGLPTFPNVPTLPSWPAPRATPLGMPQPYGGGHL